MCHTLISSGENCLSTCGFLPVTLRCLKPIVTRFIRFRDVSEGSDKKNSKWGRKDQFRGCSSALGPSRPIRKLQHEVTSSPGRACCFWTKPPACLGDKLLPYFSYKRAWEAEGKGFSTIGIHISLKISEEKKKKRRKSRSRCFYNSSVTFSWTFFAVLHHSSIFNLLVFNFEALNSFYAPLGVHSCFVCFHIHLVYFRYSFS